METWRVLAGLSVLLVLWAVVTIALGQRPTLPGVAVALVAGGVGLYLGERVTARVQERDDGG
ncbi:MAG: hypothetical protein ABEJ92_06245 [Halobacteriales archaeon]